MRHLTEPLPRYCCNFRQSRCADNIGLSVTQRQRQTERQTDRQTATEHRRPEENTVFVCVENFKKDAMEEKFRQDLLMYTSAESISIDESKRPAYKPVNESFRKLAVD